MEERVIVDSSFSAVINAPLERIDIPELALQSPDEEYQGCRRLTSQLVLPRRVMAGAC